MTQAREADRPAREDAQAPATAISPAAAAELERLRAEIDRVDAGVLDLLNERARIVCEVGEWKRGTGVSIHSAARERDVIARLVQRNAGPFPDASIEPVFREIISAMRSLEGTLRVAYLGPEGTYSHLAARSQLGHAAALLPMATIGDVFQAVERGRAELGVVPVENTTEGVVTRTLDAFVESDVTICGEILQRISHSLLSRSGRLEDVRRVASIDQPFAQCRRWLERHLAGVERVETASTAAAAKLAGEDAGVAAIASALAGEAYGLRTIEAGIEDRRDNTTRFLLIGRAAPARSGRDLTTAVFTVRKAQAGALHQLLEPFAREGVSLTAIQSRPMPGKPFEYLFFLDMEGHREDPPVARALAAAAATAHSHRVLGSFPRAAAEGAP
ncbi:MAG: prephenate dehydratase [Proteobacteria bacterium]|nr:MAG: prephenate dehydratase [Pseudomonadota bacterium]